MAEGLLRFLYGEKYEVFSAGANPTSVNPLAIKVMAEIGIDISKQYSKSIEEFRNKEIDLVVTVCTSSLKVTCPFCSSPLGEKPQIIELTLPKAKHYIHHGFREPSTGKSEEEQLASFRQVRDEIKKWITNNFAYLKIENIDNIK
jgi:arsenate reductase